MKLGLPPPVTADSCYGFARKSVFERLPAIVQTLLQQQAVELSTEGLLRTIERDEAFLPISTGPEVLKYNQLIETHKYTWSTAPWFFLESYFYRLLFDHTRYFENLQDPFKIGKRESLTSSLDSTKQLAGILTTEMKETSLSKKSLTILLYECLWGNKADLSFNASVSNSDELLTKLASSSPSILVDNSDTFFDFASQAKEGRFHFIVDNVGVDVISDLMLATLLTHFGKAKSIVFHVKQDPIFVSDVTTSDFEEMLEFLAEQPDPNIQEVVQVWKSHLGSGQWTVTPHPVWNRFEPFWDLPNELLDDFRNSDLVFIKGDANYRRVHGDLKWPHTTPTQDVAAYFTDSVGVLMIRTFKSETATGLSEEVQESLKQKYQEEKGDEWLWLSTGEYGVVQFLPKSG